MSAPLAPVAPPAPAVAPVPAPAAAPEPRGLAKASAEFARLRALPAEPAPPPAEPAPEVPPGELPPAEPVEGAEPPAPPAEGAEVPPVEAEPAAPTEVVVSLPGRKPGDPPLEIVVDDPAVANRLEQIVNDGMRRDEFNRQMEAVNKRAADVDAFDDAFRIDPIGVVLQRTAPEHLVNMAKALLTDEAVLTALAEDPLFASAIEWDEDKLALASARIQTLRYELKEQVAQLRDARKTHAQFAEQVVGAIERIVPKTWSESQADQFVEDALADVRNYLGRSGQRAFDLSDLPLVLQRRLRASGLDPMTVAQRLALPADAAAPTSRTAPAPRTPPAPAPAGAAPVKTAAELKQAAEARARATAIPTGAHGAPVAAGTPLAPPPKGSGLAGAKAYLDKLRGRKT